MATYDLAYPGAAIDAILNTAYYLQEAGYIFRGSASDYSGTPSKRVWVIAPAGFSGYGLSSAVPQGSIGICLYNGTAWVGKVINVLTLDSAPTRNSQNGVTSGGVAATLDEIAGGIMETFASLLFDDETASADLSTKLSYAVKFSVSDVYQTVTHLNILAATTSKAGLMSAEDKAKVDSFLTNLRSLTFTDTTASADQGTKITETLKATIGGVQEVIDSITILAATSSKAGLLSASDKAYIDALPSALTNLSNSISAALALMESLVGYYTCDTAAATAAKTVAATGYTLTNGGCIRIKMTNANTAANATLNINSTGAKALYYDGLQASSTNTWEAGEVLEVYYDGTQYQCASGGGKAEKIKYDNTQSGLHATNVQTGMDELAQDIGDLNDEITGTTPTTQNVAPTKSESQSSDRWRIIWLNVLQNDDVVSVSCSSGWEFAVFLYVSKTNTIVKYYTNNGGGGYQSTPISFTYEDGDNQEVRILIKKVNNGNISSAEIASNITYSAIRTTYHGGLVDDVKNLKTATMNLRSDMDDIDIELHGNGQTHETIAPNNSHSMYTNRWAIEWNNILQNGDVISYTCASGYEAGIFLYNGGSVEKLYTSYVQQYSFTYEDGANKNMRLYVKKTNEESISESDVTANVTFNVIRQIPSGLTGRVNDLETEVEQLQQDVENANLKEVKILFLGNSALQDATMWLPYVLQNDGKNIKYTLVNMYNGGYTLQQHWEKINAGQTFETSSICDNATGWTNYNNSKTLDDMLPLCDFDYLVLQEFFNWRETFDSSDLSAFKNIVDYVMNHVSHPFEVVTFVHAPRRAAVESVYALTVAGNQLILRETCASSLMNTGTAIYEALFTDLDSLGTQGHLSPDGLHAQEGLPCVLQALNIAAWIYDKLGIAGGVVNFQFSPAPSAIYSSLNVAGANGSVIDGTVAQQQLATKVAADSYKRNSVMFMEAFIN